MPNADSGSRSRGAGSNGCGRADGRHAPTGGFLVEVETEAGRQFYGNGAPGTANGPLQTTGSISAQFCFEATEGEPALEYSNENPPSSLEN